MTTPSYCDFLQNIPLLRSEGMYTSWCQQDGCRFCSIWKCLRCRPATSVSYIEYFSHCVKQILIYSNICPTRCNVTQFIYLETALHVSGGTTTHHQERKQLYLQRLVFVTPLLLPAAIVELVWVCCGWRTPPTAHWNQFQLFHDSGR
jgi:hypothetical protein